MITISITYKPGTYLYPIPDTQMKAKEGLYQQNEAYK